MLDKKQGIKQVTYKESTSFEFKYLLKTKIKQILDKVFTQINLANYVLIK